MEGQLMKLSGDDPRRAIVQLAAVVSVLHRIRIIEQRPDWRQAQETLLDRYDLSCFFEVAAQALGYGSGSVGRRSLEINGGERFEEFSIAVGLIVWLAWESEPQVEEDSEDDEWPEAVDQSEMLRWQQHVLYLGVGIVDDDRAQDVSRNALAKTPRRGVDAPAWWSGQLRLLKEAVGLEEKLFLAKRSNDAITPGDFVVLPPDFEPRLRLALYVETGRNGLMVTVVDADTEDGVRKFLGPFLKRIPRTSGALVGAR
jgi:hypothetical protein